MRYRVEATVPVIVVGYIEASSAESAAEWVKQEAPFAVEFADGDWDSVAIAETCDIEVSEDDE